MTEPKAICELCGEPMPEGEEMFKFHGYSGPCPKPPLGGMRNQIPSDAILKMMAQASLEEATETIARMADDFAAKLDGTSVTGSEALRTLAKSIRSTNKEMFPTTGTKQ